MYSLTAILQKVAIMEAAGITYNAACIEAIKTMYPKDYGEILAICREKRMSQEKEIPALIRFLLNELSPDKAQGLSGFEKMAEYARNPA